MGLTCWDGAALDEFAISVAHEICNAECFAFTGEGSKPHSIRCQSAAKIIADAIRAMAPTGQFFDDGPRRVLKAPEPPGFDWRGLLKLYMTHVLHEEGVTYVRWLLINGRLTSAKRAAISEIEAEVKKENPNDWSG